MQLLQFIHTVLAQRLEGECQKLEDIQFSILVFLIETFVLRSVEGRINESFLTEKFPQR